MVKYADDWENFEDKEPRYAKHLCDETYDPTIVINHFEGGSRERDSSFLVYVLDEEIEAVVNLLKLIRKRNDDV